MSQQREISSTERLLEFIRRRKDSPAAAGATEEAIAAGEKNETVIPEAIVRDRAKSFSPIKSLLPGALPFQKTGNVGVDIGRDHLRLVMAIKSDNRWKLPALKTTPIPKDLSRESDEFVRFLKGELSAFIGAYKCKVWALIAPAQVEIRHIRIPRVTKKQIEDVVYWSVKKEFPFDEKDSILDFEVIGDVTEQGIPKTSVMVYIAPRRLVEDKKGLFAKTGYPLTGISVTPFAIQNLFRSGWLAAEETFACLHVGFGFSRIDIFSRGALAMTRDIKTGTNSMVESFIERYHDKARHSQPLSTVPGMEEARKVVYSLSPDSSQLVEGEPGYGMSQEEIFAMIQPALERLVRQVERTCDYYSGTMGYDKVKKIHISGAIDSSMKLVEYIGSQLGIDAQPLDPLGEQAPFYYQERRAIRTIAERMAYGPALGLALTADTATSNLLFTYSDRERESSVARINRNIFIGFILVVCICSGIFFYQQRAIADKKAVIADMEHQLGQFHPRLSKSAITEAAAAFSQRGASYREIRNRYLGMALISELSAATSPNIQFLSLKLNLSVTPAVVDKGQAGAAAKPPAVPSMEDSVEIEGIITGERRTLETTLAGYALALKNSPMIKQVAVEKNIIEPTKTGEVLNFVIRMKVG